MRGNQNIIKLFSKLPRLYFLLLGGVLAELKRAANYELWAIVMVVSRAPKDLLTSSWSHSYSGSTLDSWFTFKKKWIYIQGFSVLCSWIHLSVNKWVASWVNSVPFRWRKGGFPPSGRVNLRGSRCAKKPSFLQEGGVSKGKKTVFFAFLCTKVGLFVGFCPIIRDFV